MGFTAFLKRLAVPVCTGGFMVAGTTVLGLCTVYTDAAIVALIGGGCLVRELIGFAKYNGKEKLHGKTVVITGCNTGIGFETAKDLALRGGRIIMACRDMEKCEAAAKEIKDVTGNSNVLCKRLDLSSFDSVRTFCEDFNKNETRLDLLINNAGVMMCPKLLTQDGLEMQIGTNHFGHFLLTNLLLDKLKASSPSRIVVLSSRAHTRCKQISFDDINSEKSYDRMKAYAQSKLANVLHVKELAKRLEGQ
ncbi:retinol dehydrogenase 12 [Elysia marginata]|uniref:Retinol dehydrogenase 12 n=1 Tax=Elysia marginata TaxID=1093978 RepID=A0AAV4JSI7_9GAST|nr:retinol dehydrogenase 12 [Elysia marginata]